MNDARRKMIEGAVQILKMVLAEEENAQSNLPLGLEDAPTGEKIGDAIVTLEESIEALEELTIK